MFVRLGRWCFQRRWVVLGAWLVVLLVAVGSAGAIGAAFDDELEVPDSETKDGFDLLDEHFGGVGAGQNGSIVFRVDEGRVDDPDVRAAMEGYFAAVDELGGVTVVSPYDGFGGGVATEGDLAGRVAYATVELDSDIGQTDASELGAEMRELRDEAGLDEQIDGVVYVGGQSLAPFEPPESELIGLGFAIVILVLSFGSVVAMGLPIATALTGVGTGLAFVTLTSNGLTIPEFATTIGAMIGIGVGIDYALFIVTRYRESLHGGHTPLESAELAMDTAGRAVVFAGLTVVISLLGLVVIGLEFVIGLGVAAAFTVLTTMLASVTLLPAFFGFTEDRIETSRWRAVVAAGLVAIALVGIGLDAPAVAVLVPVAVLVMLAGLVVAPLKRTLPERRPKPIRETWWYRYSRVVQGHPWWSAVVGASVLLLLAVPVLSLRLGFSDEGNASPETDARQAYDLLADAFGPGYNGPFLVAVDLDDPADLPAVGELGDRLAATEGVAEVTGPIPSDPSAPEAALLRVVPDSAPQDEETEELVVRVRDEVVPAATEGTTLTAYTTGFTAAAIDFTDYLSSRTLVFYGIVLLLSFLLLMVVFRSLLVPLKAVIMNLLSITAAYGVVVAVFQWGWGGSLLDVQGAPIEPFLPMMMFAIVFGLSMDYEVFLLSRVKEEYDRTGDAVNSVADGLAATARVITAAAAIMVVVFGSFVFEDDRVIRVFGLGLAVAVLLDATVVRMLLVPATMELLGERNWWLPRWLDRLLPDVRIEGNYDRLEEELSEGADDEGPDPGRPGGEEPALVP